MVDTPSHIRISQTPDSYRIRTVGRPPIWVNLFLLVWFIPWTGFTIHLYASYFGIVEPMNVKGSLLGTAVGFSFFWLMAFLIIALLNFCVMETRLCKNHLEDRFGLLGLLRKTTLDRASIESIRIVKRAAFVDDSGDLNEARWELCIDGRIEKTLVLFGSIELKSWSPRTNHYTIESGWKVADLEWFATQLTNWSGKTIQMPRPAEPTDGHQAADQPL